MHKEKAIFTKMLGFGSSRGARARTVRIARENWSDTSWFRLDRKLKTKPTVRSPLVGDRFAARENLDCSTCAKQRNARTSWKIERWRGELWVGGWKNEVAAKWLRLNGQTRFLIVSNAHSANLCFHIIFLYISFIKHTLLIYKTSRSQARRSPHTTN